MNDKVQLIAMAALVIFEAYAIQPWKFPVVAKMWDVLANVFGYLANWFGWQAMYARQNYYRSVPDNA